MGYNSGIECTVGNCAKASLGTTSYTFTSINGTSKTVSVDVVCN